MSKILLEVEASTKHPKRFYEFEDPTYIDDENEGVEFLPFNKSNKLKYLLSNNPEGFVPAKLLTDAKNREHRLLLNPVCLVANDNEYIILVPKTGLVYYKGERPSRLIQTLLAS
jgi:hypothetical protein